MRRRGISSPATWEVPWESWQASTQQGESLVRQRKGSQLLLSPGSESPRTLHSQPFSLLHCRGPHEPGVLLSHVPDRAVPLVEVSHLCGCADLGIFHICWSCLHPLLWYGGAASDKRAPHKPLALGGQAYVHALPLPPDAIWHHSNGTLTVSGPQETASIFATYPADFVSVANGFLDQVGATVSSPSPLSPRGADLLCCPRR